MSMKRGRKTFLSSLFKPFLPKVVSSILELLIGYYPILAKLLAPGLTIHAVEPLQRHRTFFSENVILNGFSLTDFITHKEGIASSDGMAMFIENGYESNIFHCNRQRGKLKSTIKIVLRGLLVQSGIRKGSKIAIIRAITLDDLMKIICRPVDLVQMDVQGLEVGVLHGALHSLQTGEIRTFLIGTHGRENHQECIDILKRHGYVIEFDEDDPKEQPDGIIAASKGAGKLKKAHSTAVYNGQNRIKRDLLPDNSSSIREDQRAWLAGSTP